LYKIDWSKISDEKTFQRLVNHLFALECNSPGFIPSSPYIGADGGWDGYYNGLYPKEKKEGIYSIQSKWTTKNFKDAFKKLRIDIKEELNKAQKNYVDYLRIATNAKLRTEQILELENLNKRKIKNLKVWHRENLTMRIEKQSWLRYYFFDYPQHPLLTPYEHYFSTVEPFLASFPSIETDDFEKYITNIKQFISSNNKILLIYSPGGYGKSHLLREIAEDAYQIDSTRQTWLVNAGYRDIKNAIQEEIINDRKYLLIYDDKVNFIIKKFRYLFIA
jgi:DNA replication protein DnaC